MFVHFLVCKIVNVCLFLFFFLFRLAGMSTWTLDENDFATKVTAASGKCPTGTRKVQYIFVTAFLLCCTLTVCGVSCADWVELVYGRCWYWKWAVKLWIPLFSTHSKSNNKSQRPTDAHCLNIRETVDKLLPWMCFFPRSFLDSFLSTALHSYGCWSSRLNEWNGIIHVIFEWIFHPYPVQRRPTHVHVWHMLFYSAGRLYTYTHLVNIWMILGWKHFPHR